ncbi:MAG TPA: hypothetical protein VNM90_23350 [Haliangium sp.]|nr:hypothetical protein [Haliangium sp.]
MQHTRRGIWRIGCALALALALALGAGCRSREDGAVQGTGQGARAITGAATEAVPAPGADTAARPDAPAPVVTDISADLAPLRNRFQHDDGLVRVIMLVAPT